MIERLQRTNPAPGSALGYPRHGIQIADDWVESVAELDEPNAATSSIFVGQTVICRDGPAGNIMATMLGPVGQTQQVVIRLKGWWRRQVIMPANWIQAVDRTSVHLAVRRRKLKELPHYREDSEIVAAAWGALRADRESRAMGVRSIKVTVADGVVRLTGHVTSATDKRRAGQAVEAVRGGRTMHNELVVDEELVHVVAQALADDARTRGEILLVSVRQGVVTLNGRTYRGDVRAAAEQCAARIPLVRGVRNLIEVPGVPVDAAEQQIVQPHLGQEVFASDTSLGTVERLIINPDTRRVAAIVIHGRFPHRKQHPRLRWIEGPTQERSVVIPVSAIASVSGTMVQLTISGIVAAHCKDFSASDFTMPDPTWRPPYPYLATHCLWT